MSLDTVGVLVGISKSLIDVIKGVGSILPGQSAKEKLESELGQFYGRIDILSLQLEQCESLTRMIPPWLALVNRMPLWQRAEDLQDSQAHALDQEMRSLIHASISDNFSGTFFRENFERLPGIPIKLEILRDRLRTIDRTISTVQPGNLLSLQALWPQITTQFNDARNAAYEIHQMAEDLQGRLIRELRDTARESLNNLP